MTEQNLKHIGTIPKVPQYGSQAEFFIDANHPSGQRVLVVHYDKGGYEGRPDFMSAIPDDWSEQEVLDLIFWPMQPDALYPAWEVPARAHGSPSLFKWWKGEKPS